MPPHEQRLPIAQSDTTMTVPAFRARYHTARPARHPHAAGTAIEQSVAGRTGPIALRHYRPAHMPPGPQPAILFFHGGGWVAGDLDTHDDLCRRTVAATGLQVIAVAYRLAPEHRFPAGVEDAIDAHAMLLQRAAEWGVDVDRIAVMGDGAGGTLASVVALHARDMCHPIPVAQLLFYPVTDMTRERGPADAGDGAGDDPADRRALLRWACDQYLPAGADTSDWRLSPLRSHSLSGLPPSFIAVAGLDPLCHEGAAFAERLEQAGVVVTLRRLALQAHGFLLRGTGDEAAATLAAAAAFLAARVRKDEPA